MPGFVITPKPTAHIGVGAIEKALYGVKATGHVARLRAEVGA